MGRKTFADTIDNVGSFTIQKSLLSSIYPMQLSSSSVSTLVWDAWVGMYANALRYRRNWLAENLWQDIRSAYTPFFISLIYNSQSPRLQYFFS